MQNLNKIFTERRNIYQKVLRTKKIDYFSTKAINDFKNSKKILDFYQSSIKVKSNKSGQKAPDSLLINNKTISDKKEITDSFNKHFPSFESEKNVSDTECKKYILKTFTNVMKRRKQSITSEFNFNPVVQKEVVDLLEDLDIKSSSGISGIPVVILKKACDVLACDNF